MGDARICYSRSPTTEHREKMLSTLLGHQSQCQVSEVKFWFKWKFILFIRICERMKMIMLNHLVQVQADLESS